MSDRIVVAGGPRTGKTTFAAELGGHILHTDDLIAELDWSEASEQVAKWFDEPGPWVIEGVAAVRALRKWLDANESGLPCEIVYWFDRPVVERTRRQYGMGKACQTIFDEIRGSLVRRGVLLRGQP
jgi:adenylate kinase family enzyme